MLLKSDLDFQQTHLCWVSPSDFHIFNSYAECRYSKCRYAKCRGADSWPPGMEFASRENRWSERYGQFSQQGVQWGRGRTSRGSKTLPASSNPTLPEAMKGFHVFWSKKHLVDWHLVDWHLGKIIWSTQLWLHNYKALLYFFYHGTMCLKNVKNCLNTNIYSYLETSDNQSSNL